MDNKIKWVKRLYLYIFSAVGLVLLIIGFVSLINIGLKSYVFTKADNVNIYPRGDINEKGNIDVSVPDSESMIEYQKNEIASRRQQQASNAIAMILVGLPLFLYHWNLAKRKED